MSSLTSLQQKAREVRRQGEITRGRFDPKPDDWHYKVYKWWQRKTHNYSPPRNFCCYWRRVMRGLIRGFFVGLGKFLMVAVPVAVLATIVTLFVIFKLQALMVALLLLSGVAGAAYLFFSVGVIMHLMSLVFKDIELSVDWLDNHANVFTALAAFLAMPMLLLVGILGIVIVPPVLVLYLLGDEFDLYQKIWKWFTRPVARNPKWISWLSPWQVPATALVAWIMTSISGTADIIVLITAAGIAMMVGLCVWLAYVTDKRRTASRQRTRAALEVANMEIIRIRFKLLKPELADNEDEFQRWLTDYKLHFWLRHSYQALEASDRSVHIEDIRELYYNSPLQIAGLFARKQTKTPNMVHKVMIGLGDFLVLIWNIVLTRKWKICPLVELPSRW